MKLVDVAVVAVFLASPTLYAGELLVNGGFETGNFTGWSANVLPGSGGGLFVQSGTGTPDSGYSTVGPAAGTYFALTDQFSEGSYALTQSFTVAAGQSVILSFDLFANDYAGTTITGPLDYNAGPLEFATADLLTGGANPFDTGAGVLRNFYAGSDAGLNPNPWTHYSFDISSLVAAGGTYQVRFGETDNQLYFNMGVDNVSVLASSSVPEPGTLLLFAAAAGALLLKRRKLIG